jgi:hypothetical protein
MLDPAGCSAGLALHPTAGIAIALLIFGGVGLVFSVVCGVVTGWTIMPKKITNEGLWARCGRPFLDSLPSRDA